MFVHYTSFEYDIPVKWVYSKFCTEYYAMDVVPTQFFVMSCHQYSSTKNFMLLRRSYLKERVVAIEI